MTLKKAWSPLKRLLVMTVLPCVIVYILAMSTQRTNHSLTMCTQSTNQLLMMSTQRTKHLLTGPTQSTYQLLMLSTQRTKHLLRGPTQSTNYLLTKKPDELHNELANLASKKAIGRKLIISIVDSAYIDMALNLWETSFVKFGIKNYLFICMNEKAKTLLPSGANDCYIAIKDQDGEKASRFGTRAFNRKVMVKTNITLSLLQMGYSVVVVDLDIVFLKNPMPYLTCKDCDLVIQDNDRGEVNSGFYMIRPTKAAIELQNQSMNKTSSPNHTNDQNIMNELIKKLKQSLNLKVILLDINLFQPGWLYFSDKRNFANEADCDGCIIVHNNWIAGVGPKIYRFKEMLLWVVDTDGYYSSTENKYIMYSNPMNSTRDQEKKALELAFQIGGLLKRIVILPQFNCPERKPSKRCHMLEAFESKFLVSKKEATYRESVFLQHPKVPASIKSSISPEIDTRALIRNTTETARIKAKKIASAVRANATLRSLKVVKFSTLIV